MNRADQTSNSDDLVDIGEEHHKAGRLREAESCYRKALEIDPGHPGALYYLASIAYEDGRLPFSAQLIDELLRGEPNDAEAWHLLGMISLKENDSTRACEYFKKALAIQPTYALAHYNLGNALSPQHDSFDAALSHFQQAATLNPTFAEAHFSIANMLRAIGKFEEAVSSYQQVINVKPDFEPAYIEIARTLLTQGKSNEAITILQNTIEQKIGGVIPHTTLGHLHFTNNNFETAAHSYQNAIALDSNCFTAYNGLGNTYYNQRQFDKAIQPYERAFAINPTDIHLLENFAAVLSLLGKHERAIEVYKQWAVLEPNNPTARHHLAAYTNEAVPTRADDAYVERTFNAFAENFDQILTDLRYQAPQLIKDAIQRECGSPNKQFAMLDAGCGTGLCGPLIQAYASSLTGVDLSDGMLVKAKSRNVYDNLIKAELTAFLQSQSHSFDIILSADTLIYFGALESVFHAAHQALRSNGYLFVTAESLLDSDASEKSARNYHLNPHGRYSHSESYLRDTLKSAGFKIVAFDTVILRYEGNLPAHGFVVSCRA